MPQFLIHKTTFASRSGEQWHEFFIVNDETPAEAVALIASQDDNVGCTKEEILAGESLLTLTVEGEPEFCSEQGGLAYLDGDDTSTFVAYPSSVLVNIA